MYVSFERTPVLCVQGPAVGLKRVYGLAKVTKGLSTRRRSTVYVSTQRSDIMRFVRRNRVRKDLKRPTGEAAHGEKSSLPD